MDKAPLKNQIFRYSIGLLCLIIAYLIINERLLVQSILYRSAASDYGNAIRAFWSFLFNGIFFSAIIIFSPRRFFIPVIICIILSALINIGYSEILNDALYQTKFNWLIAESGQAGNAIGQFAGPVVRMIILANIFLALILLSRRFLFPAKHRQGWFVWLGFLGLIIPPLTIDRINPALVPAERNSWVYLFHFLTAEPHPQRAKIEVTPQASKVDMIIWLVDESVNHDMYRKVISPEITKYNAIDYGKALSFGDCSSSSNFALRAGVEVDSVNVQTDLRKSASIWTYAKKAGFERFLFDGQTEGGVQNLMFPPEYKLIDQYILVKDGYKTDLKIAERLNALAQEKGRKFVYVVLSGAHFQYESNYPRGYIALDSNIEQRYEAAVRYSKLGFFDTLMKGLNRDKIAVIYTSDHGQNPKEGVVPHCSANPVEEEFEVPLMALIPPDLEQNFLSGKAGTRSHSQIFPTSLQMMGYNKNYALKYDNDLSLPSRRPVWFGRGIIPVRSGNKIELKNFDNP